MSGSGGDLDAHAGPEAAGGSSNVAHMGAAVGDPLSARSWRVAPGVVGLRLGGRGAGQVQVAYKFIDAEGVSREQCGGDRDSHQGSRIHGRE